MLPGLFGSLAELQEKPRHVLDEQRHAAGAHDDVLKVKGPATYREADNGDRAHSAGGRTGRPLLRQCLMGSTASYCTSVNQGVGANVLVGGSNRSIALQPLSLEGSVALDVVAGLSQLKLRPAQL
jgi:hypothetical protein